MIRSPSDSVHGDNAPFACELRLLTDDECDNVLFGPSFLKNLTTSSSASFELSNNLYTFMQSFAITLGLFPDSIAP